MREIDLFVSPADGEDLGPRLARLGPVPVRLIDGLHALVPDAILAADASVCSTAQCQRLATAGVDVVVLANHKSEEEEAAYLAAGAVAYVEKIVDEALLKVLVRLAG
jgi:CheY-like chemotaxis protein